MPKLVEEAGGELSAGFVNKRRRWYGDMSGKQTLGGRVVAWKLVRGGATVTHPAADPEGPPAAYLVSDVATVIPSGGERFWWLCPDCGRRADSIYLPAGRDRLGCRRCCRLAYRSQYRPGHFKARPRRSPRSRKRNKGQARSGYNAEQVSRIR